MTTTPIYPSENGQWLNNMSAPPRSQVRVAPHRHHRPVVRLWIPRMLTVDGTWKKITLDYCGLSDWDQMIEQADQAIANLDLPPFFVMAKGQLETTHRVDPMVTVGLLARTTGALCRINAKPVYSMERLRSSTKLSDPNVVEKLKLLGLE